MRNSYWRCAGGDRRRCWRGCGGFSRLYTPGSDGAAASAPEGPRAELSHIPRADTIYEAKAIPNDRGLDIWLVPEARQTCVKIRNPKAGGGVRGDCVPNRMVLLGEMSPILGGPSGVTVIGLAPNGNRTVELVRANGSPDTVHVAHNVYIARSRHGFKTVTLKDFAGAFRTWDVPDGG